ncbi:hypothetical protein D9756_000034 [Leucocoprinus leucothites]|uniref:Uncharacterized protein n=1 Tax=Leucocoprinus leucothites TaxID=201217 RepID=A0A8H5GEQ1_9AGAR|nr:hypothetical protein D9756_000034 [Leucoagaricus leucothites]
MRPSTDQRPLIDAWAVRHELRQSSSRKTGRKRAFPKWTQQRSWYGHGYPPPPGTAQSDGDYTAFSSPSPTGAQVAHSGHGSSLVCLFHLRNGYGAFAAGAAGLGAGEREAYGNTGSSGRLAVSNYADGENGGRAMSMPMAFHCAFDFDDFSSTTTTTGTGGE